MRLRVSDESFLEPIRLIPTLIHEFAHVVRERIRHEEMALQPQVNILLHFYSILDFHYSSVLCTLV